MKIEKCLECNNHPKEEQYRPFCSKRCADIDLYRWTNGSYAIVTDKVVRIESINEDEY